MRTSVRSRRPCRTISWPAACGIRCVKPSSATTSPSRTSSRTASLSGTIATEAAPPRAPFDPPRPISDAATLRPRMSSCQDSVPYSRTESMGARPTPGRDRGLSQSLERGLAVLSSFRSGRPLVGVSELAREVGLTRSTTHRYVATLAELGYLQQDPETRKYRLGPRVLDLGFSALNSMELREVAAPHLQRLSDETGYTVNMAILYGLDVVYVERCRSSRAAQRAIDLDLHVGSRLPAYCTSLGKVLLAYLPEQEQEAALDRIDFVRRGPNTIVSRS